MSVNRLFTTREITIRQRQVGVPQDYKKAIYWYRKAAEQGDIGAQNNLGWSYVEGKGVQYDLVIAYKWLYLAAETGNTHAGKNRDGIAKIMTPDQISEAKKLVQEWKLQKGKQRLGDSD